jgi:hypothetical protein
MHVLVAQRFAGFGQITQAHSQDDQAFLLADLHRMVDQPGPIVCLLQRHRQQFPLIPKSANIGGFCVTFSRCRMMNRRIFSVREVATMVTLDSE